MTNQGLRFLASLALIAPLLPGCAGGQTGDEGETDDPCAFELEPLAPNESSPLGFTANDVLSMTEGSHRADFEWLPSPAFPYGPESGSGSLRLELTSSGKADFARAEEQRPCCADELRLRVRVKLRTAGGALNESVDAVLIAPRAESASLSLLLNPAALGGSLSFDQAALGAGELERIQLDARFDGGSFNGTLQAAFEESESSNDPDASVSLTAIHLARWGEPPDDSLLCHE